MNDSAAPSVSMFDIAAVLKGRDYPEVSVDFYIDEASALALSRSENELTRLALLSRVEEHDALQVKVDELRKRIQGQKYVYNLRGIPNKVRQDVLAKAFERFPRPKDPFGISADDPTADERDNYYTNLLWEAMTVSIIDPNGAPQIHPSFDTIEQFRNYAPTVALDAIAAGIRELTDGVKAGFEAAVQDTDFLSSP